MVLVPPYFTHTHTHTHTHKHTHTHTHTHTLTHTHAHAHTHTRTLTHTPSPPTAHRPPRPLARYAVLYVYGGVYVDADSSFKGRLDDQLRAGDGFVFGTEANEYGACYSPDFYLGAGALHDPAFVDSLPFSKFKLVQWLLVARPRHPVMHAALHNIVQIVKQLYLRRPVMQAARHSLKSLVCTTGPDLLTATLRELWWRQRNATGSSGGDLQCRSAGRDYEQIGAVYKEDQAHNKFESHGHWNAVLKGGADLLRHYVPLTR